MSLFYTPKDSVFFMRSDEPHGLFSNMYPKCKLSINGVKMATYENLYQALKFTEHHDLQLKIAKQKTGKSAKALAYEYLSGCRKDWDDMKLQAMYLVVALKIFQNSFMCKHAFNSIGDGIHIVEESYDDDYWGAIPMFSDKSRYKGDNHLGRIWSAYKKVCPSHNGKKRIEPYVFKNNANTLTFMGIPLIECFKKDEQ